MTAPWGDVAHLGHVELLTPDLDGTVLAPDWELIT